jgi:hypothetical protein
MQQLYTAVETPRDFQALRVNWIFNSCTAPKRCGSTGYSIAVQPPTVARQALEQLQVADSPVEAQPVALQPHGEPSCSVVRVEFETRILKPVFHLIGSRVETTMGTRRLSAMGQGESTCTAPHPASGVMHALHSSDCTRKSYDRGVAFTHRTVYTQNGIHTERFTHRTDYTQNGLHTERFTRRRFTHTEFNSCNSPYGKWFTRRFLYHGNSRVMLISSRPSSFLCASCGQNCVMAPRRSGTSWVLESKL